MNRTLPFLLLSLLCIVFSCSGSGERRRMEQVLAEADSMNRNYIPMTSDSLLREACRYYDRHGTPNERMRAHYLLGCVYRDMGEAPRALVEWQVSAQHADTAATDCDFHTLSRVHGQMAELFNGEYLPEEMLNEERMCQLFAKKDYDTLMWLVAYERQSQSYVMLGKQDTAIQILKDVYEKYRHYGYYREAANSIEALPLYLVEQGNLKEARHYLELFETQSENYNTASHTARHTLYYYIKGMLYLASSHADSSVMSFHRVLSSSKNPHTIEMAYKGLYQAYMKMGKNDSVAKYADLCYRTGDSNFQNASTDKLRRMQAHYNYSRHQEKAQKKEKEASRMYQMLVITVSSAFVLIVLLLSFLYHLSIRRKHQIAELTREYEYRVQQIQSAKSELEEADILSLHERKQDELSRNHQKLLELLGMEKVKESSSVDLFNNEVYRLFQDAASHPDYKLEESHWRDLHSLFDEKIPCFRNMLTHGRKISEKDYRLCMLIRMQFGVLEICTLLDTYSQYVSIRRSRLLEKYYNIKGKPEDFDKIVMLIN
jgi:hypothetical protein